MSELNFHFNRLFCSLCSTYLCNILAKLGPTLILFFAWSHNLRIKYITSADVSDCERILFCFGTFFDKKCSYSWHEGELPTRSTVIILSPLTAAYQNIAGTDCFPVIQMTEVKWISFWWTHPQNNMILSFYLLCIRLCTAVCIDLVVTGWNIKKVDEFFKVFFAICPITFQSAHKL